MLQLPIRNYWSFIGRSGVIHEPCAWDGMSVTHLPTPRSGSDGSSDRISKTGIRSLLAAHNGTYVQVRKPSQAATSMTNRTAGTWRRRCLSPSIQTSPV